MGRIPEQAIVEQAVLAAERRLGVGIRVLRFQPATQRPGWRADAVIEIAADGNRHRFIAEAKAAERIEALGHVKARLQQAIQDGFPGYCPLLLTPYMTRTLAEHCLKLRLPFLDTAGNGYVQAPGLFIYAIGGPRVHAARARGYRAATAAGVRIVFALLCRPELAEGTYRELARLAGVALGTVGPVLDDLRARGFLVVNKRGRALRDTNRLLDEWITHYAARLRPKLHPRRFQVDPDLLLAANFERLNAFWGGEVAAQRLTGYLKPERFLVYLAGPLNPLLAQGRARLAEDGNTEILDAFWRENLVPEHPQQAVPPLLAYADLMLSGEGRNVETAKVIYDKFLAPAFHS